MSEQSEGWETGWRLVPEIAIRWLLGETADDQGRWFEAPELPAGMRPRPYWWRTSFLDICHRLEDAAPAAPSPDLAELEELATWLGDTSSLDPQYRKRVTATLRTAIRHLKAQPNAGPADGGKGGQ